jgi:two-component system CheB/CheR fusion protein
MSADPALFPIVGIGASAGGLEAFRRLLGALPDNTGMAYVLVQHLDPHHESILAELLSEVTKMEVREVIGDVRVEPNQVYVIPPSKGLVLAAGVLKLVPRGPAHMPIVSFLKTLADVRGSQAIGVILSGMGSDGTLGLQAIEAVGASLSPSSPRPPKIPICRAARSRPAAWISSSRRKTSPASCSGSAGTRTSARAPKD